MSSSHAQRATLQLGSAGDAQHTAVLLIEDEEAHAEIIRRAFESQSGNASLVLADNLRDARALIAKSPPALIITDLLLPDGQGLDLLPPGDQAAPWPVVIMTGHGDEQIAVEAMKAGALHYVVKSAEALDAMPQIAERVLHDWSHVVERRRAEDALQASEKRYRTLYDNSPSIFLTVDPQGLVLSANRFAAQELGYTVEELVGRSLYELHRGDDVAVRRQLAACFGQPGRVHRWETVATRKDQSRIWVRVTARMIRDAQGQPSALMVCEDVTEAHHRSNRLSFQANHDPLTSLVNRREFERRLERVLRRARSDKTSHALFYLDLDRFKPINDTLGHLAGDELLRQVAALLREHIRRRDTLARVGGDEFAVLIEHCSPGDALRVAEGLRKAVAETRFLWQDRSFTLGISLGMVPIDETSESRDRVLTAADSACYAAKNQGRDRVHVYRESDAELDRRRGEIRWVERIHSALAEGRLRLCRQPIAPLAGGPEARRYELLLRMVDEDRQLVMPGAFLPAAERYNLVQQLDRWVVSSAFRWLARSRRRLERLHSYSINLGGPSLGHSELLELITRRFAETGIPPQKICFEISETAAIANLSSARRFISAVKDLGCRFALDNFGSGLSSFAYLKNLPVDLIKIDGILVKAVADDPVAVATVRSINEISHLMNKATIAEGVENVRILDKARELGVDYAQGYHIGRPQVISEISPP